MYVQPRTRQDNIKKVLDLNEDLRESVVETCERKKKITRAMTSLQTNDYSEQGKQFTKNPSSTAYGFFQSLKSAVQPLPSSPPFFYCAWWSDPKTKAFSRM